MAGGQVPLNGENPEILAGYFSRQILAYLKVPAEEQGNPLL
jgi:hypothetical protein